MHRVRWLWTQIVIKIWHMRCLALCVTASCNTPTGWGVMAGGNGCEVAMEWGVLKACEMLRLCQVGINFVA